jgi:hypothetical protein
VAKKLKGIAGLSAIGRFNSENSATFEIQENTFGTQLNL